MILSPICASPIVPLNGKKTMPHPTAMQREIEEIPAAIARLLQTGRAEIEAAAANYAKPTQRLFLP